MGRTKKVSDSEMLEKAFEVISREGFESFTLAQVAKATKLSPAGLLKRFGSKERLAAMARDRKWEDNLSRMSPEKIAELRGLPGLREFLRLIARSVDSERLGEHARFLGAEAGDPKSRKKVAAFFAQTRAIIARLLNEAVERGELRPGFDPIPFADTLEALIQGSIFQFAFLDRRSIESHLRDRIFTVLRPYSA